MSFLKKHGAPAHRARMRERRPEQRFRTLHRASASHEGGADLLDLVDQVPRELFLAEDAKNVVRIGRTIYERLTRAHQVAFVNGGRLGLARWCSLIASEAGRRTRASRPWSPSRS